MVFHAIVKAHYESLLLSEAIVVDVSLDWILVNQWLQLIETPGILDIGIPGILICLFDRIRARRVAARA